MRLEDAYSYWKAKQVFLDKYWTHTTDEIINALVHRPFSQGGKKNHQRNDEKLSLDDSNWHTIENLRAVISSWRTVAYVWDTFLNIKYGKQQLQISGRMKYYEPFRWKPFHTEKKLNHIFIPSWTNGVVGFHRNTNHQKLECLREIIISSTTRGFLTSKPRNSNNFFYSILPYMFFPFPFAFFTSPTAGFPLYRLSLHASQPKGVELATYGN